MRKISYHDYMICARALTRDHVVWTAQVRISKGSEEITLHEPRQFATEREAENHAIAMGKHWVNNRLQTLLCFLAF
jgi:hypothetical protein